MSTATADARAGIQTFLSNRQSDSPYLIGLYKPSLETQIMVSPGTDEQATRFDDSGKAVAWSDGCETWSNHRWPYNAWDEPSYNGKPLTYDPATHLDRIGSTWWDWESQQSVAAVFDIDLAGTKSAGTNTVSVSQLTEIVETLSALPYVTLVRSTGGKGVHGYVFFQKDNLPSAANHTEHSQICQAVLRKIEADTGRDFGKVIDCSGAVLWLWAKDAAPDAFTVIKEQTEFLTDSDIEPYRIAETPTVSQSVVEAKDVHGLSYYVSKPSLLEVAAVVNRLPTSRADNRKEWIETGIALHNMTEQFGIDYFPLWEGFSRQSPKFVDGECAERWAGFNANRASRLGYGSLRYWAGMVNKDDHKRRLNLWELLTYEHTTEWIIPDILAKGIHGVFGAPKKCHKTLTCLEMALSGAYGVDFLGRFPTNKFKTLFFVGETKAPTLKERALAMLKWKGLPPSEDLADMLHIVPWVPKVSRGLDDFDRELSETKPDLVFIDPTFMALDGTDAASGFSMYQQLGEISAIADKHSATVIMLHHVKKNTECRPLDLDDLSYGGFAEWAGQWFLMSRRTPYKEDGKFEYMLQIGGRDGQSERIHIDIDEGTKRTGRKWELRTRDRAEAKAYESNKHLEDLATGLAHAFKDGETIYKTSLRETVKGVPRRTAEDLIPALVQLGILTELESKGNRQPYLFNQPTAVAFVEGKAA